ncbi:MAG: metal ABC transporter ATP-binding protein [Elusimicrobiota bacterium]
MDNKLIEFRDVTLSYGKKKILSGLNFIIYRNDFTGVVGPNGAGKTTLLKAILGLIKPASGEIVCHAEVGRTDRPGRIPRFGYVPQLHRIDDIFPLTAEEVVLMGRYPSKGLFKALRKEDRIKTVDALKMVSMEDYADRMFRDLSGGLRQKTLIARALAGNPEILVLDEPTNDLDIAGEKSVMDVIKRLHSDTGIAVIMASHLLNVVINYVDKIGFINSEIFRIENARDALTRERLRDVYKINTVIGSIGNKNIVLAGD